MAYIRQLSATTSLILDRRKPQVDWHEDPLVCVLLRDAAAGARAVTVLYEKMIAEGGLHATQYTALQLIEAAPNLTRTELAEAMGIDQTTATRTLALIKGRGLVTNTIGQGRRQRR